MRNIQTFKGVEIDNMISKVRIGIVGCDSFHTPELIRQFSKRTDCEVTWVDCHSYSNLKFAKEREISMIGNIPKEMVDYSINLLNHPEVDLYCVLNVDASTHLDTYNVLKRYNKPIFIDKPIFYDLKSFDKLGDVPILSSSGLRFCQFLKELPKSGDLIINGPLAYVDGIDGYFWYGIHLIEMLHTVGSGTISKLHYEKKSDCEIISGIIGKRNFIINGYYKDPEYSVSINNESYKLESMDMMYASLADAIIKFALNPIDKLSESKKVIKTILDIHNLKEKSQCL